MLQRTTKNDVPMENIPHQRAAGLPPRILTPHPASKLGLLLRHYLLWNLRLSAALADRYELMICRCAVLAQPFSNGGTASHGLD